MESTTQPILCCLGETVAGCPTQFLMERAFGARGLDWRAISVEVPPDQFSVAIDGMAVMNFKALRIYPSLFEAAVQAFGESNPIIPFVGSATSASLSVDGWQAWDHYGFGALKLASEKLDIAQSVCWLHGNSRETRSVIAALLELKASNQPVPSRIVWTDRVDSIPMEFLGLEIEDQLTPQPVTQSAAPSSALACDAATMEARAEKQHKDIQVHDESSLHNVDCITELLLFVDNCDSLSEHQQDVLQLVERIHLFSSSAPTARLTAVPSLSTISELDIAIAAEVYDFQRWTEQPADCSLFRDAYDEFCAF